MKKEKMTYQEDLDSIMNQGTTAVKEGDMFLSFELFKKGLSLARKQRNEEKVKEFSHLLMMLL